MAAQESEQFIPGNHTNVRNINRCVILNVIRQFQPIARVEIARHIQLTKSTISNIVNELIEDGLVQEISVAESTGGRRPTLLKLSSTGVIIGAVSIHRDTTVLAIGDMEGNVLRKTVVPTQKENPEQFLQECGEELGKIIAGVPHERLLGVGVCVPGLVSSDHSFILHAPKLGWNNVAASLILKKRLAVPVYVENNANLEALARLFYGKSNGQVRNFVHIEVGEGIGVGIVLNQQLLRGTSASSIEFGHTTINEVGEECSCGNRGCWEAYASDWATIRRYNRLKYKYQPRKNGWEAPEKVSEIQAEPVLNGVMLNWKEPTGDIVSYLIYRDISANFAISPKNQIGKTARPPFIDVAIVENVRYFYRVQPVNSLGQLGEVSPAVACVAPPVTLAFHDKGLDSSKYQIGGDRQVSSRGRKFIFGTGVRDSDNIVYRETEFENYIVVGKVKPLVVGPYDSAGILLKVQSEECWYYALIAYGYQLKEKYNLAFMRRRTVNQERDEVWLAFYPLHIDPKEEYTIQVGVFGDWIKMKAWKSGEQEPPSWQLSIKDDLGYKKGGVGFRHFGRKAEAHSLKLMPLHSAVEQNFFPTSASLSESDRHIGHIVAAALKGDEVAIEALKESGRYLGLGVANIFNGLGINTYYITGQMVRAWHLIEDEIMRELKQRAFAENVNEIKLVPFEQSENHELLGCMALVTRTLFEGYRIVKWHVS